MVPGRKRVLVVDDDVKLRFIIREVLDQILAETGIDIEEEETAHDAYVRVAQGADDSWFIITDYQMPPVNGHPIRDGMDLVRGIRGHEPDVRAHIIFMTGENVSEDLIDTLGADRCLEKPRIFRTIIEDLHRFVASD